MATLKVKATICCATCGCGMKKTKAVEVAATEKESAIKEAEQKIEKWKLSLKGKNCNICASIIKDLAA